MSGKIQNQWYFQEIHRGNTEVSKMIPRQPVRISINAESDEEFGGVVETF